MSPQASGCPSTLVRAQHVESDGIKGRYGGNRASHILKGPLLTRVGVGHWGFLWGGKGIYGVGRRDGGLVTEAGGQ